MKDQEITRLIAEKVMGWSYWAKFGSWLEEGTPHDIEHFFEPLACDASCMAAWDKFSEGRPKYLVWDNRNVWEARVGNGIAATEAANPDRRRAMCECMAKAVVE